MHIVGLQVDKPLLQHPDCFKSIHKFLKPPIKDHSFEFEKEDKKQNYWNYRSNFQSLLLRYHFLDLNCRMRQNNFLEVNFCHKVGNIFLPFGKNSPQRQERLKRNR